MSVRSLDHFTLRAPRELLDRIRDFYRDVVGLTDGDRPPFSFFGYWLYAGDRPVLHLIADESATTGADAVFDHAAFHCTGLREFEQRLKDRQVPFRRSFVPGTKRAQLFLEDPAGNGVELLFTDAEP